MPEFTNADFGAKFRVPDRPTVRQQLAYFSEAGMARGKEMFERLWLGGLALAGGWGGGVRPGPEGGGREARRGGSASGGGPWPSGRAGSVSCCRTRRRTWMS